MEPFTSIECSKTARNRFLELYPADRFGAKRGISFHDNGRNCTASGWESWLEVVRALEV